jgi:hypothetical protein
MEAIFPIQLSITMMKLLQDEEAESNDMQRGISQLIKFQQENGQVQLRSQAHQARMKEIFDRRSKDRIFMRGDIVLKWNVRR